MDNEREQIEQVFELTSGDLSDEPWEMKSAPEWAQGFQPKCPACGNYLLPCTATATGIHPGFEPYRCTYWYEGVPEYAEESFPELNHHDIYSTTHEYRTIVRDVTFGSPPERTIDGWERVATFTSSGETECPERGGYAWVPTVDEGSGPCYLCEAKPGEEHGYIYIGDGWAEVVYRRRVFNYERNRELDKQYGTDERSPMHRAQRFPAEYAAEQSD